MYTKLAILFWAVVLALFALCGRIAYLNVKKGNEYSIKVLAQQSFTSTTIPYKRGDIKDRNGNVLATSVMVYNLIVDSKIIMSNEEKYLEPTVSALAKYFDLDKDDLKTTIREKKNNSYWIILKNLEYSQIEDFQDYQNYEFADTDHDREMVDNTKGVWFEKKYKRMYPYNSLACTVLGFANSDNSATVGIESSYGDFLKGTDGREYGYMGSDNNMEVVVKDAINGDNVVSSIDMNIQRIVQKAIKKYMKKYNPKMIAVVIADPNTGEILAMADDTTFNLNQPYDLSGRYSESEIEKMSQKKQSEILNGIWNNYCITDSFEPGSTAKPFTVAAALEEGKIKKNDKFFCDGYEQVDVFKIKCHSYDKGGHGTLDVKGAIAESCNDYLMRIGKLLGKEDFVKYQAIFGFGTKTGIDLPGETRGLVYGKDMGMSTLATNSFGQNFTVNMIQMVAGFSSLINGGYYYEPRVVKQIVKPDGEVAKNYSKTLVKQTVTRDTSNFIKQCLRAVVTDGTGSTAAIDGYTVGGKTGTAEKVDTSGKGKGRLSNQYILSFLGCVPCENPQVVCYTVMDTPKENPQATAFNTDLWTYIMKQVLPYMGIEKSAKLEKKAIKQKLETEFYSDGIIEGDDGKLILKEDEEE
ncbi:MAG: penicillin-binding protein 2 [Eubacterium sp.]|nr:penicillin-binding protein 2 [Eubacterium sp.]